MKQTANVIRTMTLRQMRAQPARTWLTLLEVAIASGLLTAVLLGGISLADIVRPDYTQSELARLVLAAAAVVAMMLLPGAAFLIQSAFAVSLSQRVRALGQLAGVGATRRQLRASVWWEALLLGAAGVPAGMAAAMLGLWVVFRILDRSEAVRRLFGPLHLAVSGPGLLLCALWCAGMLLLAAGGPARAAFRVQPVETLSPARRPGRAPRARPWQPQKPPEPQLARRSLALEGARRRALRAGMAVSLALILAAAGFSSGVRRAYQAGRQPYDCRLYVWGTAGSYPEALLQQAQDSFPDLPSLRVELLSCFDEDPATGESLAQILYVLEDEDFAVWYGRPLPARAGQTPCVLSLADSFLPAQGEPLLRPIAFLAPLRQVGTCERPLPLHAAERTPQLRAFAGYTALVTSRTALNAAQGEIPAWVDRSFAVYYEAGDGALLAPTLQALCSQPDSRAMFQDNTPTSESAVRRVGITLLLDVFSWGFTVLVFLAAAVSLIGTVSADLVLHRRDLALLQSVGATRRQQERVLRSQCFAYCAGLPFGLLAGGAVCLCLARLLWIPPLEMLAAAVPAALAGTAALVGACRLALHRACRGLARLSVAQTLRQLP